MGEGAPQSAAVTQVEHLRSGRKRAVVLKLLLSQFRSRDQSSPVLVFEGPEDVGPYEVWIRRIVDDAIYEPIPANGKGQLLEFRASLANDQNSLSNRVYFFVDRDFDELRGYPEGPDLFRTSAYSVENYLVTAKVLNGILLDEFKCAGDPNERESVTVCFSKVLKEFVEIMAAPNRRLFQAVQLGIRILHKEEKIQKYISVSVDEVTAIYSEVTAADTIRLEREVLTTECTAINQQFDLLPPLTRHRGKFALAFFLKWLDELAAERKNPKKGVFQKPCSITFSSAAITLRSLATRSEMPEGLREFISSIPHSA